MKNIGKIFRYPPSTDPPLAWERFLADRDLWTITCNRCRKGAECKTEALEREQDPSSLCLSFSWMTFIRQDPRVFCMPMATFPSRLTAACCHCSELSAQAIGEGSVEISFTGIVSPLTEMKPPWGLETAAVQQQETRNEADCRCFGTSSVVGFHDYPILKHKSTMSCKTNTVFLVSSLKLNKKHKNSRNGLSGGLHKVTAEPAPGPHFHILVTVTLWRHPVVTSPQWDKDGRK